MCKSQSNYRIAMDFRSPTTSMWQQARETEESLVNFSLSRKIWISPSCMKKETSQFSGTDRRAWLLPLWCVLSGSPQSVQVACLGNSGCFPYLPVHRMWILSGWLSGDAPRSAQKAEVPERDSTMRGCQWAASFIPESCEQGRALPDGPTPVAKELQKVERW